MKYVLLLLSHPGPVIQTKLERRRNFTSHLQRKEEGNKKTGEGRVTRTRRKNRSRTDGSLVNRESNKKITHRFLENPKGNVIRGVGGFCFRRWQGNKKFLRVRAKKENWEA